MLKIEAIQFGFNITETHLETYYINIFTGEISGLIQTKFQSLTKEQYCEYGIKVAS